MQLQNLNNQNKVNLFCQYYYLILVKNKIEKLNQIKLKISIFKYLYKSISFQYFLFIFLFLIKLEI